ncbi:MAG: NmrA family NAD(P)-binding protein [Burkholderiales bacterium]|nr:NmrA family NAD(P)-binding protein [Burkholderiales bacterium]
MGSALVRQLSAHTEAKLTIVAASRRTDKRERLAAAGMEAVALDYDDAAAVRAALRGVERAFLATGYSVDMLTHSKVFLDAARDAGVRHIVHLGAAGSDDQAFAHLAWHAYVERYIEALGFDYTHLQPRTYMSNVLAVVRPGSTTLRQFFGAARIGWIAPEDIAAVAAAALLEPHRHKGKTYCLAAEAMTMHEVARTIAAVTGVAFTYDARDPADLQGVLLKLGMEPTYAIHLARGIGAAARGEIANLAEVNDNVERVTGRPRIRWADFAARHRDRFLVAGATAG